MKRLKRMRELIEHINEANAAYYGTDTEIISNKEWDDLYDELLALERETGVILSNSPTQNVGYAVSSTLQKEKHDVPALSLDKTKNTDELVKFLGKEDGVLSWKLDGLTIVLTYENGKLQKAVTRGNGVEGEVVTDNAKNFANVPLAIPNNDKMVIRGEAIITYNDFDRINESLPEGKKKYENPRNLCAGSVRQLDPNETKRRNVRFKAFALAMANASFSTRSKQLDYLKELGFDVVDHVIVNGGNIREKIEAFSEKIKTNPFPSDGLVLQYNDIAYGESLGTTSKFPRDSIAFKWEDDLEETVVTKIEWSASRTGRINPVAVFEPVWLAGTTVSRASVHNVSILKKLSLTVGDTVSIYKANMIIPQIAENKTKNGTPIVPDICPVCGHPAKIRTLAKDAETLWCTNPKCAAKHIGAFTHAVKRDALNMEGLSEETLRKFMDVGLLGSLPDLFHLKEHEDEIVIMEGFGKKSFAKLTENIEKARHTDLQRLIYALGIDNIGRTESKDICMHFDYDVSRTVNATMEELLEIEGIGNIIAASFTDWFKDQCHQELFEALLTEIKLETPNLRLSGHVPLSGQTFVVTGSLNHFKNRNELKAKIESLGGKVSGSVSSKTSYLINNDFASQSGKNKEAKKLGIPIITEDAFLEML